MKTSQVLSVIIHLGIVVVCYGGEVILQNGVNGYVGCSDTYIVQGSDRAQGSKDALIVEGYDCTLCTDQRALIRFDLSSISQTPDIASAVLSIYSIDQPRPGGALVKVHKVSKLWSESAASWITALAGVPWSKQGGDFVSLADTTYRYNLAIGVWHTVDITSLVKDFIQHPDQNFGIMLYMEPIMYTVRYASSNALVQTQRPKLTITGSGISSAIALGSVNKNLSIREIKLVGNRIVANSSGRLTVTNLNGKVLVSSDNGFVDISEMSSGVYVALLKSNMHSVSHRFEISR